jgi:hypothetical protein
VISQVRSFNDHMPGLMDDIRRPIDHSQGTIADIPACSGHIWSAIDDRNWSGPDRKSSIAGSFSIISLTFDRIGGGQSEVDLTLSGIDGTFFLIDDGQSGIDLTLSGIDATFFLIDEGQSEIDEEKRASDDRNSSIDGRNSMSVR